MSKIVIGKPAVLRELDDADGKLTYKGAPVMEAPGAAQPTAPATIPAVETYADLPSDAQPGDLCIVLHGQTVTSDDVIPLNFTDFPTYNEFQSAPSENVRNLRIGTPNSSPFETMTRADFMQMLRHEEYVDDGKECYNRVWYDEELCYASMVKNIENRGYGFDWDYCGDISAVVLFFESEMNLDGMDDEVWIAYESDMVNPYIISFMVDKDGEDIYIYAPGRMRIGLMENSVELVTGWNIVTLHWTETDDEETLEMSARIATQTELDAVNLGETEAVYLEGDDKSFAETLYGTLCEQGKSIYNPCGMYRHNGEGWLLVEEKALDAESCFKPENAEKPSSAEAVIAAYKCARKAADKISGIESVLSEKVDSWTFSNEIWRLESTYNGSLDDIRMRLSNLENGGN